MAFQWYPVPSFAGGMNVAADPSRIDDSQWSNCHAVMPEGDDALTAPAWQSYLLGSQWLTDGSNPPPQTAAGWVPDLMQAVPGGMLVFSYATNPVGGIPNITRMAAVECPYPQFPGNPVVSQYGVSGTVEVDVDGIMPPPMTTSGVAAQQLILTGIPRNSINGALRYDGGTATAIPNICGYHACAAGGHGIIGNVRGTDVPAGTGFRTIKISDGGAAPLTTWTPDISNSADFFQADGGGPIVGLAPISGGFVIIMLRGLQVGQTTRQIPPFTVDRMQSRGGLGEGALTPMGLIYMSQAGLADFSGNLLAPQITPYLLAYTDPLRAGTGMNVIYDNASDAAAVTNLATPYVVNMKLRTSAVWRHRLPFTPTYARVALHGTITFQQFGFDTTFAGPQWPRASAHTVMDQTTGNVWAQVDLATPEPDAYVDTKDFCFGATPGDPPNWQAYVDRIKLDWEGTALDVYGAVRNHLGPQAAPYWQEDATTPQTWVKLGTLTGGLSELPVRLRGKFFRFRFQMGTPVAPFRVRGFSLRYLPASDRRWDH